MRVPNLTKEQWNNKFNELFSNYNYVMQPDEKIIQCNEKYPSYWFVSTHGYLFSIASGKIEIVKPLIRKTKKDRSGVDWYYAYYDKAKQKTQKVSMHKFIAEHFLVNDFKDIDNDNLEVHHKTPRNHFKPTQPQLANRVDNLQIVPRKIHKNLTKMANTTPKMYTLEELIQMGVPVFPVDIFQLLNNYLKQSEYVQVYKKNIDGKTEATLVKSSDIKFIPDNDTKKHN